MKLNKLLVVGGLIALYTHTQLLAQEPKWVINNSIVNTTASTVNSTLGQVTANSFASNPNHSFTNLNPSSQYKVVHVISPVLPYTCLYSPSTSLIIN